MLPNLWNVTPVHGKRCIFQSAQLEKDIFFDRCLKLVWGLDKFSRLVGYTDNVLSGLTTICVKLIAACAFYSFKDSHQYVTPRHWSF